MRAFIETVQGRHWIIPLLVAAVGLGCLANAALLDYAYPSFYRSFPANLDHGRTWTQTIRTPASRTYSVDLELRDTKIPYPDLDVKVFHNGQPVEVTDLHPDHTDLSYGDAVFEGERGESFVISVRTQKPVDIQRFGPIINVGNYAGDWASNMPFSMLLGDAGVICILGSLALFLIIRCLHGKTPQPSPVWRP